MEDGNRVTGLVDKTLRFFNSDVTSDVSSGPLCLDSSPVHSLSRLTSFKVPGRRASHPNPIGLSCTYFLQSEFF